MGNTLLTTSNEIFLTLLYILRQHAPKGTGRSLGCTRKHMEDPGAPGKGQDHLGCSERHTEGPGAQAKLRTGQHSLSKTHAGAARVCGKAHRESWSTPTGTARGMGQGHAGQAKTQCGSHSPWQQSPRPSLEACGGRPVEVRAALKHCWGQDTATQVRVPGQYPCSGTAPPQ